MTRDLVAEQREERERKRQLQAEREQQGWMATQKSLRSIEHKCIRPGILTAVVEKAEKKSQLMLFSKQLMRMRSERACTLGSDTDA